MSDKDLNFNRLWLEDKVEGFDCNEYTDAEINTNVNEDYLVMRDLIQSQAQQIEQLEKERDQFKDRALRDAANAQFANDRIEKLQSQLLGAKEEVFRQGVVINKYEHEVKERINGGSKELKSVNDMAAEIKRLQSQNRNLMNQKSD